MERMTTRTEGRDENSNQVDNRNTDFNYNYDSEMAQDIQQRNILHWNYRNLKEIPREVIQCGAHIQEIYLKRNCIVELGGPEWSPQVWKILETKPKFRFGSDFYQFQARCQEGIITTCYGHNTPTLDLQKDLSQKPSDIVKLRNLTNIYLIGNQLTSLPEEIGQLRSLKVLDVSQNLLDKLPGSLGDLYELQELLITQNQIRTLPLELQNLSQLKFFELSGNRISYIEPGIIKGLTSLEELCIDNNPLQCLPRNLCSLRNLRYVSVCHTNLRFLPSRPIFQFAQANRRNLSLLPGEVTTTTDSLHFRFDGNRRLHYVPVWISQFYRMKLDCFGCALEEEVPIQSMSGFRNIFRSIQAIPLNAIQFYSENVCTLYFDDDIKRINRPRVVEPNSLLEMCLRVISSRLETNNANVPLEQLFPVNIAQILRHGPTAQCFMCEMNMFTQIWALPFSLPRDDAPQNNQNKKLRLSTTSFCGSNCVGQFARICLNSSSLALTNLCKSIVQNEISW